jgi:type IV pilus assembly protein PilW
MHTIRHSRGLSLVELMVSVLIGMLAILVVTQATVGFEAQKRTTVGGAESIGEGSIGLFTLKREIQKAGYGIADSALIGCTVRGYIEPNPDIAGSTGQDIIFSMIPVQVQQDVAPGNIPTSSVITIGYGSSPMMAGATLLIRKYDDDAANLKLNNRYGMNNGDAIILASNTRDRNCVMRQITDLPAGEAEQDEIKHESGATFQNAAGGESHSTYNKSSAMGVTFLANQTKVFNIGSNPISQTFYVFNNQLVTNKTFDSASPTQCVNPVSGANESCTILLDNVLMLRAQYGFDNTSAGQDPTTQGKNYPLQLSITSAGWNDFTIDADGDGVTAADPDDLMRIGAVRIAIIIRNRTPEKPDSAGNCTTTTGTINWTWGSYDPSASGRADWRCYRYRALETVIPLRNIIWTPPI